LFSKLQRKFHLEITLKNMRFHEVRSTAVQDMIVLSDRIQFIAEEPIPGARDQSTEFLRLMDHRNHGSKTSSPQIRQKIFKRLLASLG
jgi:hypothetical protein